MLDCSRRLRAVVAATVVVLAGNAGCGNGEQTPPAASPELSPELGKRIADRAGCGSCHRIPGILSAQGEVGPPLDGIANRAYLAGVVPNTFDNMVLWLARPETAVPGTAMPNVGLSEAEAENVAAYLYTLD